MHTSAIRRRKRNNLLPRKKVSSLEQFRGAIWSKGSIQSLWMENIQLRRTVLQVTKLKIWNQKISRYYEARLCEQADVAEGVLKAKTSTEAVQAASGLSEEIKAKHYWHFYQEEYLKATLNYKFSACNEAREFLLGTDKAILVDISEGESNEDFTLCESKERKSYNCSRNNANHNKLSTRWTLMAPKKPSWKASNAETNSTSTQTSR